MGALATVRLSLLPVLVFMAMAAMGMYNARQRSRVPGMVARIVFAVCMAMLATRLFSLLTPLLTIEWRPLLFATGTTILGFIVVRLLFERVIDAELFKRRVLVFGAGKRAAGIAQLRRRADRRGFNVVGYLRAAGDGPGDVDAVHVLAREGTLLDTCRRHRVDEIVVAMDDRRRQFPMSELLECRLDGVEVIELVTFLERETGKIRIDLLNPSWMIFSDGFNRGRIRGLFERLLDVLASLALLSVAWPFMVLTMLAIKLEEGMRAPVLYSQIRVGQYGRPFGVLKFRSMRVDAERDGKAQWARTNDSRVTRVGGFIRTVRIDELPQIFNVLRGDMSFVGPRPERPEFVGQLGEKIPYYQERHSVRPGITGWAQLCYPYGSSERDAAEKLQYDLYYVKNHSPLFYLAILLQTVEVVIWRKGAR